MQKGREDIGISCSKLYPCLKHDRFGEPVMVEQSQIPSSTAMHVSLSAHTTPFRLTSQTCVRCWHISWRSSHPFRHALTESELLKGCMHPISPI